MRIYRRHTHCKKSDGLTVDNVLCKIRPPGHLTANGKWICLHGMTIKFPEITPEEKSFIMLQIPSERTDDRLQA